MFQVLFLFSLYHSHTHTPWFLPVSCIHSAHYNLSNFVFIAFSVDRIQPLVLSILCISLSPHLSLPLWLYNLIFCLLWNLDLFASCQIQMWSRGQWPHFNMNSRRNLTLSQHSTLQVEMGSLQWHRWHREQLLLRPGYSDSIKYIRWVSQTLFQNCPWCFTRIQDYFTCLWNSFWLGPFPRRLTENHFVGYIQTVLKGARSERPARCFPILPLNQ